MDAEMVHRFRRDPVAHPSPVPRCPQAAAQRAASALRANAGRHPGGTVLVAYNTLLRLALCTRLDYRSGGTASSSPAGQRRNHRVVAPTGAGQPAALLCQRDAGKQQQFNSVISQGKKAIVMDPVDSTAAASLVKQAQSQGVKVIAYRNGPLRTGTRLGRVSRLVLINGAPGTGKSTLARLYAERHPLTLALDLDVLRAMLGGWIDQPAKAGLITRAMAIEAARVQLRGRRDVLVPQYVGRLEFLLELEQLSQETGAEFIELVLVGDPADVAARFYRRCSHPEDPTHVDAGLLIQRSGGAATLGEMLERLSHVMSSRPTTITIGSVDGQVEETYAAMLAAIDAHAAPATRETGSASDR